MNRPYQPWVKWLQFALIIVIALGIYFRFVNLDRKTYWHDETFTSLRVSGYSLAEATEQLYSGREISVANLQQYQSLSPERSAIDTIKRLAQEVPEHPPLYYVIARFWAECFGSSVTAMRSLPAFISLLAFPVIYWLCLELFSSSMIGWMAVALFAISPIYVRYAQEARPYSLWIVITLLSCLAILRATRRKTKLSWGIYTLTTIAGLYCHLLSSFVLLGQGIYVLAIERFKLSKNLVFYLFSCLTTLVSLIPWFWVIWLNRAALTQTTDWMKQPLPLLSLIRHWNTNLCQLFIAWHFRYNDLLFYLAFPILALLLVAIYTLYRQTAMRVWLFILTLIVIPALVALPDLIWGGKRSTNARYFLPCYLGAHLAIAYLLTTQSKNWTRVQMRLWQIITVLVISAGVLTCAISAQASTWWGWSEFDVEVSRIVNQFPRSLIVSEMPFGMIMPLSHRLKPNTKLMLLTDSVALKIPDNYDNVFIYNPSDRLQSNLKQQGFQSELTYQFQDGSLKISLYHLKNKSR